MPIKEIIDSSGKVAKMVGYKARAARNAEPTLVGRQSLADIKNSLRRERIPALRPGFRQNGKDREGDTIGTNF